MSRINDLLTRPIAVARQAPVRPETVKKPEVAAREIQDAFVPADAAGIDRPLPPKKGPPPHYACAVINRQEPTADALGGGLELPLPPKKGPPPHYACAVVNSQGPTADALGAGLELPKPPKSGPPPHYACAIKV